MFRALLFPSSGAHYYSADYNMGRPVLGFLFVGRWMKTDWTSVRVAGYNLQPGNLSSLPTPNFQPTATQEPDGPCCNQHYNREFLMMGITVPETC